MEIKRKARAAEIPKGAQGVFFCCDACNTVGREAVIADILSMDSGMDCVVIWLEMPGTAMDKKDEKKLRDELHNTKVLVWWVTAETLQSLADGKWPEEYIIAREINRPVLPIVDSDQLFLRFTQLAGGIHGIAMRKGELPDEEYKVNLKAQLETFLVSRDTAREIEEKAFTSRIFLGYRKIDVERAREFMKFFHDFEELEAVAIWYDHFLTAGRLFDEEIEESIEKSNAFTLLVTKNLMEKNDEGNDNYVVSKEYPFAQKREKQILPIQVDPIDRDDREHFDELFSGAGHIISLYSPSQILSAFRDTLRLSEAQWKKNGERAYWLGMAYLKRFGVEQDIDRSIRLLEYAAEGNEPKPAHDAANQLADIFQNGIVAGIDYKKVLHWRKRCAQVGTCVLGIREIAGSYSNVAVACKQCGYYSEAMEWYQKALGIIKRSPYKPEPAFYALLYNNIATLCEKQGDDAQALEWHQKALEIREKELGYKNLDTAMTYHNIANVYSGQGDCSKALLWQQKALAVREQLLGPEHPDTAAVYSGIAATYDRNGDYQEALEMYQKALTIEEKTLGELHPVTAMTYNNIANVYRQQGNYPQALLWQQKALKGQEQSLGTEHPDTAISYNNIAAIYVGQGNYSGALERYRKALSIRERMLGTEHPDTVSTYINIATVFYKQEAYDESLTWYQKALAVLKKTQGDKHPQTALAYNNIAYVYIQQGEYKKALESGFKALAVYQTVLGRNHPDTVTIKRNIAVIRSMLKK